MWKDGGMGKHKKALSVIITVVVLFFLAARPVIVSAAQVVTDQVRDWAKRALEEERSLKGTEAQNTITVLYFVASKRDPLLTPLQKGMAIMLITDLKKLEKFNVVERVKLQALLEEMKLSKSGLVDEDTRIKLGKLMKARWIVGGKLDMDSKKRLEILSQVLDAPERKIMGNPSVDGLLNDLLKLEKDLLFKIVDLLQVELTPKQREILAQPVTLNLRALFSYFKGVDASDRGDYEKAAGYYREAIREDPSFNLPRLALSELFELKLVKRVHPWRKRKRGFARSLRGNVSLTDTLVTEAPMKRLKRPGEATPPVEKEEVVKEPEQQQTGAGNNGQQNYGYPFGGVGYP